MNKKCFATILSSKEVATNVAKICEDAGNKPADKLKAIKAIQPLVEKFNSDFGSVDPSWSPEGKPMRQMNRKCFAMIKTSQETYSSISDLAADTMQGKWMSKVQKNFADIQDVTKSFITEFGDVDPSWKPEEQAEKVSA